MFKQKTIRGKILIMFCLLSYFLTGVCASQSTSLSNSDDCNQLLSENNYADAFVCFAKVIENNPQSALNWAGQGDTMNNMGFYHQALVYYTMASELDPSNADILTSEGRTFTRLGDYDSASKCFNNALNIDPNNEYLWRSIGDLFTKVGDNERANEAYAKAGSGASTNPSETPSSPSPTSQLPNSQQKHSTSPIVIRDING